MTHPDQPGVNFDVTIVCPLLNEEDNVVELYRQVSAVMDAQQPARYEVIFVDDGSTDRTFERLSETAAGDERITIIQFTKRFGQTAGWAAAFEAARGRIIVPIDGDLQNDPNDIPRLVAKLDQPVPGAWDIVSGWRKNRHDKLLSRKFPSVVANKLIKKLTWTTEIHDFGCSLKAYRREVLEDVHLYGEMHRFLPAVCKWRGARITEEVVNHRPRTAGKSKYGLKRTVKVILDLITMKFMGDYLTKPIYFFGKLAMIMVLISFVAMGVAVLQKFNILTEHGQAVSLNSNIFVLFAMMSFLMAVMFVMIGVISELLVRIYHESQDRKPYKIRKQFHGGSTPTNSAT
jgi:glycosyltransferase involved in cell wall biosynthesis